MHKHSCIVRENPSVESMRQNRSGKNMFMTVNLSLPSQYNLVIKVSHRNSIDDENIEHISVLACLLKIT